MLLTKELGVVMPINSSEVVYTFTLSKVILLFVVPDKILIKPPKVFKGQSIL